MALRFPVQHGLDATLNPRQFPHTEFDHDVVNRTRTIFWQIWGRTPLTMQLDVLTHLERMQHQDHPLRRGAVVAVLPTGAGKPSV
jgi:ribulose bisphosphate carboxylase small subunit